MPRCKHKMYCVFCFVFLMVAGHSWLLIRQEMVQVSFVSVTLFVQCREEMKGKMTLKRLHPKSDTVVKDKKDLRVPLDYHTRRFCFFAVLKWQNIFDDFSSVFLQKQFEMQYVIILSLRQPFPKTWGNNVQCVVGCWTTSRAISELQIQ